MERGFEYLVDIHGIAGAREIFERICTNLFQSMYGSTTKSVKVSKGDGGIDVLVGEIPSPDKVYQCKFFLDSLGASQRQQIKESFETVTSNYDIAEWLLCLPSILDQKDLLWWSKWKNEKSEETGIKIELCDGSYLIHQLKCYDIYAREFDDDTRNKLDLILAELNKSKQRVFDAIIYADVDGIEEEYNDFIFVKMLESANIVEVNEYKIDFFNAEISKQESLSKDEVEGLKIYNNLKTRIYSLWRTQFNLHKSNDAGQNLLNQAYLRIEDLDSTTLQSSAEYNLVAKKGILHQLANDKRIGWVTDYLKKLTEYMGE
ncbi:PDDEXK family nuclease [Trichococcus pasteurii]|uniref:Restriction endonuclease type iv mrr n=1 Tax=Trichococcus pasteurii TaxID=43064 RepID=A0A1W1IDK2_9LACT|nr:hypothetical protein [Trichococcus pasteurii]SFE87165.1 hypothetical protein SAMN04488086_11344 [Trichococcus pasteurii]SLM51095.1 restriction endonuclease type iv mrr [Trichococcus pasteurii]SSB91976.1 restriction endonuclease type iv mrr [Trichococcus pasteurii]